MIRVYWKLSESFNCRLIQRCVKHFLNENHRPLLLIIGRDFIFKFPLKSPRVVVVSLCWNPFLNYFIILFWRRATNWAVIIDLICNGVFFVSNLNNLLFSSFLPILLLFLRIHIAINLSRHQPEINLIPSDITNEIGSEVRNTIFKSDHWVKFIKGQVRTNLLLMFCLCGMRITL